jgi:hypothetical protein
MPSRCHKSGTLTERQSTDKCMFTMIASSFNLLLLFSPFLFDLSNSEDVTVYPYDSAVFYTDLASSGPSFASLTTYAEFQCFSVTIPIGVALALVT